MVQKSSKINPGGFRGVLEPLGFINAERRADKDKSGANLAPLGRFCVPCWRPLDFEESPINNFPTKSTSNDKGGAQEKGSNKA